VALAITEGCYDDVHFKGGWGEGDIWHRPSTRKWGEGWRWLQLEYDGMLMCVDFYSPPKNLRKLTTRELPVVTLGEGVEGRPCAGRDLMILASSSYCAWDSRGSWPKRPKAHGAAVDVGNREKEEEGDILFGG